MNNKTAPLKEPGSKRQKCQDLPSQIGSITANRYVQEESRNQTEPLASLVDVFAERSWPNATANEFSDIVEEDFDKLPAIRGPRRNGPKRERSWKADDSSSRTSYRRPLHHLCQVMHNSVLKVK